MAEVAEASTALVGSAAKFVHSRTDRSRLVQRTAAVGAIKLKCRDLDFKPLAVFAFHFVASAHEPRWGLKRHAAGVFEPLAGREHRLFPDHAFAADLLPVAEGIGDDPMAAAQLHRVFAA